MRIPERPTLFVWRILNEIRDSNGNRLNGSNSSSDLFQLVAVGDLLMYEQYTAGKVISNELVELAEIIRAKNTPDLIISKFKKKLALIEETEYKLFLFYKDQEINDYSTFNDYYGYGNSYVAATNDALERIKDLEIEPESGLTFKVYQTIKQFYVILTEEPKEGWKKKYKPLEMDNHVYLADETKLNEILPYLKDSQLYSDEYEKVEKIRDEISLRGKEIFKGWVWDSVKGGYQETINELHSNSI